MSDTKISEVAVEAALTSMEVTKNHLELTPRDRIVLMLAAALPHLQGEAVPFGWVIRRPDMAPLFLPDRCAHMIDSFRTEDAIYLQTTVTPVYLHPQPAELAGQQGDGSLNTSEGGRRYVADFFARELRRHDFNRYITTTLAADFACALAQHLAATGKQPVGEVQGDALVTDAMVEAAKRAMYFHCQPDATEGEYLDDKEEGDALVPAFKAALQAALAARQPGAQVPVVVAHRFIQNHQGLEHTIWMDGDASESEVNAERAGIGRVERAYAAPPAQGIDLDAE